MSFLNIDRSEFERSLLINSNINEGTDSVDSLIENYVNEKHKVPTTRVTPIPGFCIKTRTKKGEKVFINVCHTAELPRPTGARMPMSIGNENEICDKSGKYCVAFDVAVNSIFFENVAKRSTNEILISTIIEAVSEKHGLELIETQYHIVKNLKSKGKIQPMEIEKRPVKEDPPKKPLITEVKTKKPEVEAAKTPDFNLLIIEASIQQYASEIDLINVLSKEEISLQLGEDRLFLTTNGKIKYKLEYHFPQCINVESCSAEFDDDSQILTLLAPLQK